MNAERILVVDDEPDICGLVSDILTDEGYHVNAAETAASARLQITQSVYDLVLLDIWMPDEDGITLLKDWKENKVLQCPVVMMSGHGTVETAVEATRLGAYAFVEKPLTTAKLIQTIRKALDSRNEKEDVNTLARNVNKNFVTPVGTSPVMKKLFEITERCAQVNTNLLVSGEEGAGRYTIARYIHEKSDRAGHPFVVVSNEQFDMARVDESTWSKLKTELIDSIKFAQNGTIFFENIDQITQVVQKRFVDLLHQLSAVQVFKRFNVKVVASITADSSTILNELQTTLSMTRISVPALRNHSEDIPELVNLVIDNLCASDNYAYRKCSIAAQNAFLHYQWPRNIAELKALIQELLVTGGDEEISVEDVKRALASRATEVENKATIVESLLDMPLREAREAFEKQYLLHQLKRVDGSVSKLAELVGMERTHLYRKLRSLGIGSKDSS
ncbi:MAG: sigma-54-dependent transcriptional regulator [Gammaproteobacteria bacterium]